MDAKTFEVSDLADCKWSVDVRPHCSGDDADAWREFLESFKALRLPITVAACELPCAASIETPDDELEGRAGDFIIKGPDDELFLCDRDTFLAAYKLMENAA